MAEATQQAKTVNLADLTLQNEESVAINENADHFAKPAPPPDGKWRVKLNIKDGEWKDGTPGKAGKPALTCSLNAKIIKPGEKWDGRMLFDNFVSTMIRPETGTSKISAIYKLLRKDNPEIPALPAQITRVELAKMFSDVLAGEPTIGVESRWHAQYDTGEKDDRGKTIYKTVYRGMKKFPKIEIDGEERFNHVVEGPNGEEANTNAEIILYISLEDMEKAGA